MLQGTPRKFKDTVRRIQDGQPIWFGKGRGPVFFQVQAALLADLRRMFDVSLPEREGPVNFKDLELWNKVPFRMICYLIQHDVVFCESMMLTR